MCASTAVTSLSRWRRQPVDIHLPLPCVELRHISLGRLKAAGNAENVRLFDAAEFSLAEVRVEEFGHMVFVNFYDAAPTLHSLAGAMVDEFRTAVPQFDALKLVRRGRSHVCQALDGAVSTR